MIAYHGQQQEKDAILAQLYAHAAADQIVKGYYWENGKGCAVGCTLHSSQHKEYEDRFGIPQMLAHLEDCIFDGLPNARAKEWPIEFMSAIEPGADLSCVGWRFLHWLLTDETVNPGITHELVRDAVAQCAATVDARARGAVPDQEAIAAMMASSVARASAEAPLVARAAVWGAAMAAKEALSAARATHLELPSVAIAAAWAVAWAVKTSDYTIIADKLLSLLKEASAKETAS